MQAKIVVLTPPVFFVHFLKFQIFSVFRDIGRVLRERTTKAGFSASSPNVKPYEQRYTIKWGWEGKIGYNVGPSKEVYSLYFQSVRMHTGGERGEGEGGTTQDPPGKYSKKLVNKNAIKHKIFCPESLGPPGKNPSYPFTWIFNPCASMRQTVTPQQGNTDTVFIKLNTVEAA